MRKIDIVVMGKTGAGKSTLINSILGEDLAEVGIGKAVTRKNMIYSKIIQVSADNSRPGTYGTIGHELKLYDTVGLEIDESITEKTLCEIKKHIEINKQRMESGDIHYVWFCVSSRNKRFESYELQLIKKLSIDYEIPFVIVITQCAEEEENELAQQVKKHLPSVPVKCILAKELKTRGGIVPAYGVDELLQFSINDYKTHKVKIIESKLKELDVFRKERINKIERTGYEIVLKYSSKAGKIGFLPGGCIPVVHGMCIKMISELNKIVGLKSGKDFSTEIFTDIIIGLVATPMMMVPLLSSAAASAYVEQVGGDYLNSLISVVHLSTDSELKNNSLMKQRLKKELKNLKK